MRDTSRQPGAGPGGLAYISATDVGGLTDVGPAVADDQPAIDHAPGRPALSPAMDAATGRDHVAQSAGRRLPVVAADGRFLGVLALTTDLQFFACDRRTAPG